MVTLSQWPLPPTSNAQGLELAVRHADHASGPNFSSPKPPLYTHSPNDSYSTSFQEGKHLTSYNTGAEPVSVFDTERKICGVKRRTFVMFLTAGLGLVLVVAVVGSVAAIVSSKASKSNEHATITSASTSAVQISTSQTSLSSSHSSSVVEFTSSQVPVSSTSTPITQLTPSPTPSPASTPETTAANPSTTEPAPAPALTTTPATESPISQTPILIQTDSAPADPNATPSVELITVTAPAAAATP